MARGNSWSGVSGESRCQAYINNGAWVFEHNEKPLSNIIQQELNQFLMKIGGQSEETVVDFIIPWTSSGYYDAGSMYGGSDQLGSPPEGDDERDLAGLVHFDMVSGDKDVSGELSKAASGDLFGWVLEDIIMNTEIDRDSGPEDRADYEYDRRKDEPDDDYGHEDGSFMGMRESYFEKKLDTILNEKSDGSVRLSDDSDFDDEESDESDEDEEEDDEDYEDTEFFNRKNSLDRF